MLLVLKKSPRDFKILLGITFFQAYVFFNIYGIIMWILRDECQFSDAKSGIIFGSFSFCVSVFGIFMGIVIDYLLIRRTMLIQMTSGIAGMLILSLTLHPIAVCLALFIPLAFGMSGTHSVIAVAIQRYIRESHRSIAFTMRYSAMNLGAVASSFTVDLYRLGFTPFLGINKWSFFIACNMLLQMLLLLTVRLGVRDIECYNDDWETRRIEDGNDEGGLRTLKDVWSQVKHILIRDTMFRRFILLSFIMVGGYSVLVYDFSLYPLYMKRAPFPVLDPSKVPFMMILTIDPVIVIILSVIVGAIVNRFDFERYWVILLGTCIGAFAPFFMMISQYWSVVLFVVVMAIGESIWSPLFDRYVCEFTQKGQEGIFFGLAGVINAFSRIFVSSASGLLLQRFCPSLGNCSEGKWIWLIAGCMAMVTPILLLVTMKCTRVIRINEDYKEVVELDEQIKEEEEEEIKE
jgi:MFS family permease